MSNDSFLGKLGFCFLIGALLTTAGYAQFSVLYSYGSHPGDPVDPQSNTAIAQGRDGNLYSTAIQGGAKGDGAAFMITPSGTLTVLYSFCSLSACADGHAPYGGLTLGTDGNFYGTTSGGGNTDNAYGDGVVFKMTSEGALTVLHAFDNPTKSEGYFPYGPPVEGLDGNFYGTTSGGGSSGGCGTIYKVTPRGTFTILHTFPNAATDGCSPRASLVLGTDGNLYGMASYGAYSTFKITPAGKYTQLTPSSALGGGYAPLMQAPSGSFYGSNGGQIFKMTSGGAVTILHTSSGSTDPNGYGYNGGVAWASDGNLYGDTQTGGTTTNCGSNLGYCGVIFKMTASGAYTDLFDFENPDGFEGTPVIQHTNGILYGQTDFGGTIPLNAGTFWRWNKGLKPFVSFMPFTGKVGDQIEILGQGFDSSSVVKFNGVVVASHTVTGSTFITATVPAGTLDGYITVTTGGTTLTSLYKFLVHDSWGQGMAMPTPTQGAATGVIGGKVYVVGGATSSSSVVGINQIYSPTTNSWKTGASMTTARFVSAGAVVNNILYVIGGNNGGSVLNVVEAYNPTTNTWTTKSPMPTARDSVVAVVEKNIIYVIGGQANGSRLATVESYNPATDTWTEESPMLAGKSWPATGLLGSTIVAAGGLEGGGITNGNEGYTAATNSWKPLTGDPTPRQATCSGVISGLLYSAGGTNEGASPLTLNETFSLTTDKWTTPLAPIPNGTAGPGNAVVSNVLYCFGGSTDSRIGSPVFKYVQIYQP